MINKIKNAEQFISRQNCSMSMLRTYFRKNVLELMCLDLKQRVGKTHYLKKVKALLNECGFHQQQYYVEIAKISKQDVSRMIAKLEENEEFNNAYRIKIDKTFFYRLECYEK